MCDHNPREPAMTVLSDKVWCDPCLAPIVKALNDGGLPTVASCCGHGEHLGSITLADGRYLVLAPDAVEADRLAATRTPIAGVRDPFVTECVATASCEVDDHTYSWPCDFAPGTGKFHERAVERGALVEQVRRGRARPRSRHGDPVTDPAERGWRQGKEGT